MTESGDGCCCYLCNECPCSFATLDELQKHLHTAHLILPTNQGTTTTSTSLADHRVLDVEMAESDADKDPEENQMTIVSAATGNNNTFFGFNDQNSPTSCSTTSSGGLSISVDVESSASPRPPHSQNPSSTDFSSAHDENLEQQMPLLGGNAHYQISPTGDGAGEYKCQKCPRAFDDRDQLNVHYTHTHRERPHYVCDACGRQFAVKRELSTHSRTHCGEQPHRCDKCGKEFGTKQLLKKHNMWHTGERSHVCTHCGKAFFQKGHLTQHLMIHNGGRPHRCVLCEKTFIFKFDLNRHMKIHAERGHSCPRCAKCFPKREALDEHMIRCKFARKSLRASDADTNSLHSEASSSPSSHHQLQSLQINGVIVHNGNVKAEPTVKTEYPESLIANVFSPQKLIHHAHSSDLNNNNNGAMVTQQQQSPNDMDRAILLKALLTQQQQNMQHQKPGTMQHTAFPMLVNQQNLPPMFPCLFCPLKFPSQQQMLVHWSITHFRPSSSVSNTHGFNGSSVPATVAPQPMPAADLHRPSSNTSSNNEKLFRGGISSAPAPPAFSSTDQSPLKLLLRHTQMMDNIQQQQQHPGSAIAAGVEDSATTATTTSSSSCASSPHKASPVGADALRSECLSVAPFGAHTNPANSNFGGVTEPDCPMCEHSHEKQMAAERALADARMEAERLRAVLQRLGALAAAGQLFLAGGPTPPAAEQPRAADAGKMFWMC